MKRNEQEGKKKNVKGRIKEGRGALFLWRAHEGDRDVLIERPVVLLPTRRRHAAGKA